MIWYIHVRQPTMTAELVHLEHIATCVGRTDVQLAAVVQQISRGRRAVVGAAQHVRPYHVLHVADATRAFVKMTCWGDDAPTLSLHEHAPDDAVLRVGDIVLFSGYVCVVHALRRV